MESKQVENKKVEVTEPFEDLTGVGAPYKKESRSQYLERRHREEDETRSIFYKEGLKGGLIFSGVATTGIAAACFKSHTFKKSVTWNIRAFLVSSAFIAGFWIYGETASMKLMKQRVYDEMDQYYNHPNEKKN
ncbi:hypothetical protein ACTFIZ_010051 [Dictyostelium cf. discoideum]